MFRFIKKVVVAGVLSIYTFPIAMRLLSRMGLELLLPYSWLLKVLKISEFCSFDINEI